jgi:hypothetical protein
VSTQLENKAVNNSYDLPRLISESKPGAKVTATILRGGKDTPGYSGGVEPTGTGQAEGHAPGLRAARLETSQGF